LACCSGFTSVCFSAMESSKPGPAKEAGRAAGAGYLAPFSDSHISRFQAALLHSLREINMFFR
jgi:hypothetical protein